MVTKISPDDIGPELQALFDSTQPPIAPGPNDIKFPDLEHTSRKRRFLIAFVLTAGNITRAAAAAGVTRGAHFKWMDRDPKYKAAFLRAQEQSAQILEDEARRRAFEGTLKGVYYEGRLVNLELEYSDCLMLQLLKARHSAHKPASSMTIKGEGKNGSIPLSIVPDEALANLTDEQALLNLRVLRDAEDYIRSTLANCVAENASGDGSAPPQDEPDPGTVPADGTVPA